MKKRGKWILAGLALLAAAGAAVWFLRPDWQFRVKDVWHGWTDNMDRKEVEFRPEELKEYPVSSLDRKDLLFLINEEHPLAEGYVPDLVSYKGTEVRMTWETAEAFAGLSQAVSEQTGEKLYIRDSYRSEEEQEQVYEEQPEVAAVPGSSEHSAGLALDVYTAGFAGYAFLKSEAGQYVNTHCWEEGFIIRYPQMKEGETKIPYEPWHIRLVGIPHAEYIYRNNLTLESYLAGLETGKFYQIGGYLVSRQAGEELLAPEGLTEIWISQDNCGGYVLTGKWTENEGFL